MPRKTLLFALLLAAPPVLADVSGNIGWQSHYIYRGIPQSESSAQGGLDYEGGGFYLGTWAADVGMGAEVDLYGGYNWTVQDFSFGIGTTGYFYTDDFDDTYKELNLSVGHSSLTLDFATGEYDNFTGPTQDYNFLSATYEHASGVYGVIGGFGGDFDGDYYSLGYGFALEGIDLSLAWVYTDDKLGGGDEDNNIVFSIGKSFDLNRKPQ
ncbi:MAG: TorF family putative porin [Gammaproteobacteria bacterium]|nr:TorF family putative porin [Gammaproteobacteria bacterium]